MTDALSWTSSIGPEPKLQETAAPAPETAQKAAPIAAPRSHERAVIGALLADWRHTWPLMRLVDLGKDDFVDPLCVSVYAAARNLVGHKQPVDLFTVGKKLPGVDAELCRLVDDCPVNAHVAYHVGEVVKAASVLRLASVACRNPDEAASEAERLSARLAALEAGCAPVKDNAPTIRAISDYSAPPAKDDPNELLRKRFLCRGGALLLVGPTGIGKSSFVLQGAVRWSLGMEFFGIQPATPLRVLIVQAENDDGDIAEMRDGVFRGLTAARQLGTDDLADVAERVAIVCEDSRTGREFGVALDKMLTANPTDLLIIDPALAYLGGDALKQADVTLFCRNILNPIIHRHKCGLILVHHTNKPPRGEEKSDWKAGDLAYLGQGAADWANWARGVVAIRALGSHSVFELCLGKRGRRAGWRDDEGKAVFQKYIAHASEPDSICWRDPDAAEVMNAHNPDAAKAGPKDWTDACRRAVEVAGEKVRTKAQLLEDCRTAIVGGFTDSAWRNKIRPAIDAARDNGMLEEVRTHDGTRLLFLIGPPGGSVGKRRDEIERDREERKQRELETE